MSEEKLEKLNGILLEAAPDKRLAIAFSGGIDSRFLSYTAKRFGFKTHLYHFTGPHLAPGETEEAIDWANKNEFQITVIPINPLEVHEVSFNQKDRCYYCKKVLFSKLVSLADAPVCDGTNHSDLGAYRPGIRALEELNIHSPLAQAGITKAEIRRLAKETGLDRPEQPSKPCMLTRFPYQHHLEPGLLTLAGELEKSTAVFFQSLVGTIPAFRVRQTGVHRFELHIEERFWNSLTEDQKTKTREFLVKKLESCKKFGIKELDILPMETLSGFFDRQSGCVNA